MRDLNWNVIGLARNPDPAEPDEAVEDEVEARVLEIWSDADLLFLALDDASMPFDLHTATLIRDAHRRLAKPFAWTTDSDSDLALRAICSALQAAVAKAARHDVDNPSRDP